MCRYHKALAPDGQRYKLVWACMQCRIGWKSWNAVECHACKGPVHCLGHDYRVPRKTSGKWKILELALVRGESFDSCGCTGPGDVARSIGLAKTERRNTRGRFT